MVNFVRKSRTNRRIINEDSSSCVQFMCHDEKLWALSVADGMGGLDYGEDYSLAAIAALNGLIGECVARYDSVAEDNGNTLAGEIRNTLLPRLAKETNARVMRMMTAEDKLQGGTTLSCVILYSNILFYFNCGDSPIYLLRRGKIRCLSFVHNEAYERLREGTIDRCDSEFSILSSKLTQLIGLDEQSMKYLTGEYGYYGELQLEHGDIIVVGSDGAFGTLDENEIAEKLQSKPVGHGLCDHLFQSAALNTDDNQTVIIAKYIDAAQRRPSKGLFGLFKGGRSDVEE